MAGRLRRQVTDEGIKAYPQSSGVVTEMVARVAATRGVRNQVVRLMNEPVIV